MTDTHDTGEREEQWEKRRGEVLVPLNGDDTWYIVPVGWDKENQGWPIAQCENEADANAILAARAQAGLAQRYREAFNCLAGTKDMGMQEWEMAYPEAHKVFWGRGPDGQPFGGDDALIPWLRQEYGLTAGPEAAAE